MGEGEGGMIWENGIETCIISYKKRISSPGSIQDTWGWCTIMTQRDGTGREVGGGIRIGNMCTGDGQGGLACCDSWGRKESDMTERLI